MFQLFLLSLVLEIITPFFHLFSPQWSLNHWNPLCSILFLVSLYADSMTIITFSCRITALNQSFWSSQLNSQWPSRCFHLGVPQIPLVSTPPHWTLVCFPPSLYLPTASPSNQDLSSSFTPSLILSQIKLTMKSIQLYVLNIFWSPLFPSGPSRPFLYLSIITVDLEYCLSLIKTLQQFLRAFRNHWCYDDWLITFPSARAY